MIQKTKNMMKLTLRHANIITLYILGGVGAYLVLKHFYVSAVSQVQILWTLLGIIGAVFTGFNLKDSISDLKALRKAGRNGDLEVMAKVAIRVEAIRFSKMVSIVTIGILALESEPVLSDAQRKALHIPEWTTVGILLTALLMWIVIGTVAQAVLDRQVRQRFYHKD